MVTSRTIVSQIEILRPSGAIQLEMKKQVLNDGVVIAEGFHRTSFAPGTDIDDVKTKISAHLAELGAGPLVDADWSDIAAHAALAWTPDILAAWAAQQAARVG